MLATGGKHPTHTTTTGPTMKLLSALFAAALLAGPAVALPIAPEEARRLLGIPEYVPPTLEQQMQRVKDSLPPAGSALLDPGLIAGGPVYVRSHTRCNSSKCWPVRAYTRSR
jgi:hypothetical protein